MYNNNNIVIIIIYVGLQLEMRQNVRLHAAVFVKNNDNRFDHDVPRCVPSTSSKLFSFANIFATKH